MGDNNAVFDQQIRMSFHGETPSTVTGQLHEVCVLERYRNTERCRSSTCREEPAIHNWAEQPGARDTADNDSTGLPYILLRTAYANSAVYRKNRVFSPPSDLSSPTEETTGTYRRFL